MNAAVAAGKLRVIVGTSHMGTQATIALTQQAIDRGATAVMITPSAQPAVSQVHMPLDLILRLVREIPTIVSIKAEAVPSPQKIAALKQGIPSDRNVTVLTGLGALYGFFDLERGSDGFNTGFAFPEVLLAILREFSRWQG